jgi:protein ImuB
VVPGEAPNAELFPTRASEHAGLTRLIERLQARLGREQVRGLQLVQDHRPERATVTHPADPVHMGRQGSLAASPAEGLSPAARLMLDNSIVTRPVWLCAEPEPLPLRAARPCIAGRTLQLLAGPERIESGWWDGALAARDYYIADAGDGALVWIYRDRLPAAPGTQAAWFLHGRFG